MGFGIRGSALLTAFALLTAVYSATAQVNVTTYHNDLARTGANTAERILTPANVNSAQFGKLFSTAVQGDVYAQPLYLANVAIAGGTHNVLYVATEHDTVYAIDADNGAIYWQVNLIPPGGRTINTNNDIATGCVDTVPEVGITGTPVIDPAAGTLYVVAKYYASGAYGQTLHALDVGTGADKLAPTSINASVAGTGTSSKNGVLKFDPRQENQRAALSLVNGHLLIAWGSHCDIYPWHGWLISYNASTLAQEAAFSSTPNGVEGGIWMTGGGIAADAAGSIYFATGNGTFDGTADFGDSIIKMSLPGAGAFTVQDYFTPFDQASLYANDTDVAAGGILLLPTLPSGRQLLVNMGKKGTIVLLDRSNLGKYCVNLTPACTNNDPQIVQEIIGATAGVWGSAAYWNGNLYWTGANESIHAYSFDTTTGAISTAPTSQSAEIFAFTSPPPVISSNGNSNGILWALDGSADNSTCVAGSTCLGLWAYDATNLGKLLYNSGQAPNNRDAAGSAIKFGVPIIADGKVYAGGVGAVTAFGLLGSANVTPAPAFSPAAGTYLSGQTVTLADATAGAAIYYTTNGTTPTTASTPYTAPIALTKTTTLQAIAVANGATPSGVGSNLYTISAKPTAAAPALRPAPGVYATAQTVTLTDNTPGATIYYTTNGATPTTASAVYAGPISVAATTTIKAIASAAGYTTSGATSGVYTIGTPPAAAPTFSPAPGSFTAAQTVTIADTTAGATIHYTTNGTTPSAASAVYAGPITVAATTTLQAIAVASGYATSGVATGTYSINTVTPAAAPTLSPSPGSYAMAQTVTLADTTPGATIYYTTNGTTPTTASAVYAGPISVAATTTIQAIAYASGFSTSAATTGVYTIGAQGPVPVSVSLAAVANVYGLADAGTAVTGGGVDGHDNAFAANLLGTSVTWGTVNFRLAAAGPGSAATNTTIPLPTGSFTAISLLASGVNGGAANQVIKVTYGDGTTTNFTQSFSDWYAPKKYPGESVAATMAYRVHSTGTTQAGPVYLYGYALPLNAAKVVSSITLPANANVVVVGVDLTPVANQGAAAMPQFSPAPGTYTNAQSVTLADATPNAVIHYTTDGSTPTSASTAYTAPISVTTTTTINAVAIAAGFTDSPIASATYSIQSQGTTPVSVSLEGIANLYGLANSGATVTGGGADGHDNAFDANLLGASVTWGSVVFTPAVAGPNSAVSNKVVPLPQGRNAAISLLASGVNGARLNEVFVVTYTDGSATSFTQSLSDWYTPKNYAGEAVVAGMADRIKATGVTQSGPVHLYGYSFPLDAAKTVASLTLPGDANVVVVAIDLTP
jgi:hypothetical protein